MSRVSILAERMESTYQVPLTLGVSDFTIKLDTGAKYTVISAKAIRDTLTQSDLARLKSYCEARGTHKKKFISASGHSFYGYAVIAHDVEMGGAVLPVFLYYLMVEIRRDIALLGFDFIDRCRFTHEPEGDIVLAEFDLNGYGVASGAMDCDEVIAFLDSLSE